MVSDKQDWANRLIKARHARTEEGDSLFCELIEHAKDREAAQDPFVIRTLIATFRDDCNGDGIDEEAMNILMLAEPRLWISLMLDDLPRLNRESRQVGGCLLESATRTPDLLVNVFKEQSPTTKALLIEWMEELSRSDKERGFQSEITPMLSRLRAADRMV